MNNPNLSVTYMGLDLKNPVIASASGFTSDIKKIKLLKDNNAGAIVLKSIFEEEIISKAVSIEKAGDSINSDTEANSYINYYVKQNTLDNYLNLIEDAKKEVSIPVIASIHCVSSKEWTDFAKSIQKSGADALELNIFILPSDVNEKCEAIEKRYFDIIKEVKKYISIPVAIKIGYHFSGMANFLVKLSKTDISGMVLFNRVFNPDIDIDSMKITSSHTLSVPEEISIPLRWVALLSGKTECDLAATTGIHDGNSVIKMLLAGAKCVEIASALYKFGPQQITAMLDQLKAWMEKHNYNSIDEFRGKMSAKNIENPRQFERAQFMKYFSGGES